MEVFFSFKNHIRKQLQKYLLYLTSINLPHTTTFSSLKVCAWWNWSKLLVKCRFFDLLIWIIILGGETCEQEVFKKNYISFNSLNIYLNDVYRCLNVKIQKTVVNLKQIIEHWCRNIFLSCKKNKTKISNIRFLHLLKILHRWISDYFAAQLAFISLWHILGGRGLEVEKSHDKQL